MFYVYIIFSDSNNTFYKGITADPRRRIFEHNNGLSRHTKGKGPWKFVFLNSYISKREALREELRVKKLNLRSLYLLINSDTNLIDKFDLDK
jgi:putative endonuclease